MRSKREIHASVKDQRLVQKRRDEMIRGAVTLFKEKGFHRTTTREIAKAAGFSIGTLYEYIGQKEDVLYLVCDNIYEGVKKKLEEMNVNAGTIENLKIGIAHYFRVMDELQDEVLVMYQEVKSLSKDALPYVLKKELEMVGMFEELVQKCIERELFTFDEKEVHMLAQNIFVQGQMWAFRRWALHKRFTLDEYIEIQTNLLLSGIQSKTGGER
ncbi:TetR/AcrR family transcriptional regulator [Bacillus sp. 2205SS5-2]|uniref:TetR/AcrR family transcriptional regulator n=1 Tax=Bacillus sp. 2205SS5-2 TaxID=3109031 RepID=UPI0030050467